jgi:outer membrane receptor for ferrienterochelin and colicins
MKKHILLTLLFLASVLAPAQDLLRGFVGERDEKGIENPLVGVNVYWLGTSRGSMTDTAGRFAIPIIEESKSLVVRYVGYVADTVLITGKRSILIFLRPDVKSVGDVDVVGERSASYLEYSNPFSKNVMTEKELFKAACCNLSESFQTNPSIDVSFTDAITGTKQIEMLGLSGIYTQTTLENMPYIRGLTSNVGLTFIPGTWIEAINVSKGIGSVANGYESITGQIDVDLRKPQNKEERKIFLNIYGNQDQRMEANLNFRQPVSENFSSMTLLHFSSQRSKVDENRDGFLDMPLFTTINLMQQGTYILPSGFENRFGIQYVSDIKDGGTHGRIFPLTYSYGTSNSLFRVYGKTGYVFQSEHGRSIGLQWSLSRYKNDAHFGSRLYNGEEETGYVNVIYQDELSSEEHKFRTGISFLFDQYKERFDLLPFQRIERVPGVFFEYTFTPSEKLSAVAGIRVDEHDTYGTMITPRLHIRYTPQEDWVLRFAAGRGYRTANIFAENSTVFASSRTVSIVPSNNFGYGLKQEIAWNYGFNLTHYFTFDYRDATFLFDIYRTEFEQLVLADLDANSHEVRFYSVLNGSYSNSIQAELNIKPLEHFDARIAYRFLDVKQKLNGIWHERPLTAQHRALATVSYSTERDQPDEPQTSVDVTMQWFGKKRIPSTLSNPVGFRAAEYSPDFATINLQFTRTFTKELDLYLGIENLFGYTQHDPILDSANPNGSLFDASLIWGPLSGRMIYAGLRYRI